MRRLMVLLLLGAVLGLGACGGDPLDLEPDTKGRTTPSSAEPSRKEPTDTEADLGTTSPRPGVETRAARRRFIYEDARTLCGELGVRQIVRRFNVQSGSAREVARAYSAQNYSAPFQEAGFEGCLAGFKK